VSYFNASKTTYNAAAASWQTNYIFDIAAIFGNAYRRTATPKRAVKDLVFDENIFSVADFATAEALVKLDGPLIL